MLDSIKQRKLKPDRFTFTTLLTACGRTGGNSSEQVKYAHTITFGFSIERV